MIGHRLETDYQGPPVLGVGAFLKSTLALLRPGEALVTEVCGGLDTRDGLERFEAALSSLLGEAPTVVAHDLHPDFPSTTRARSLDLPAVGVQHHHAHVAAVMAEHGHHGPVLGLALDGFGLGAGGGSWGGELLRVDASGFERLGHLRPLPLPGGDKAAREPWRMAAAALHVLGRGDEIATRFPDMAAAAPLARLLDGGSGVSTTTSAGRLFDAAAGLLGLHPVAAFEGEAPMALEALVSAPRVLEGGWRVEDGILDLGALLGRLANLEPADGADLFHGTLVVALAEWTLAAAATQGLSTVVFSGGCFFNKIVATGLREALEARGLRVLFPDRLGPGDPAVSLGQAWAAALMQEG